MRLGTAAAFPNRIAQLQRFALVGLCGTAAHYAVLITCVELSGASVLVATTAGFITGALVNYVLNRRFTFLSDAKHSFALPRFLSVAAIGAGINWLIVGALLAIGVVHYLLAQVAATLAVLMWNFSVNSAWTFRT